MRTPEEWFLGPEDYEEFEDYHINDTEEFIQHINLLYHPSLPEDWNDLSNKWCIVLHNTERNITVKCDYKTKLVQIDYSHGAERCLPTEELLTVLFYVKNLLKG